MNASSQNQTETSGDTTETVKLKISLLPNEHFPISLNDDESNLNSDDGAKTSKKRALERILIYPQLPIIGRRRAISVMAVVDDHRKKRKILSECALKWTLEEVNLPLQTNLTMLPTTSAKLYNTLFRSHAVLQSPY
jgi:hypothetical protein